MKYQNITLIGTSHIAKESLDKVEKTILKEQPDLVCLELDNKRLGALLNKKLTRKPNLKDILRIGIKGWLFSIIGSYVQEKLGKKTGLMPGGEMLHAFKLAKKNKIKVALIDRDIEETLKRFGKALSWKEKGRFVMDLIKGFVFRKKLLTFDLTKVPPEKLISQLLNEVKDRYPNVYRVLVHERNIYMAKQLSIIAKEKPDLKILAVIGAGHEKEMIKLIQQYTSTKVDII